MAGEGRPGPTESLQGPAHEPGAPSEAGEGQPGQHRQHGDGQDGQPGSEEPGAEPEGSAEPPPGIDEATIEPAPMRQVAFMGVGLELPSTHPSVVLHEIDPPRRELRVTIAQPEGVAIAYAWRGMATPRPLTHDLLTTILQRFGLQVDAVRITGVEGPVFHAELALSGPSGSHTVECRPSDALALALRQPLPVPIMVAEEVLAAAGRFPS
jgi:bifunctional DNase/RNase